MFATIELSALRIIAMSKLGFARSRFRRKGLAMADLGWPEMLIIVLIAAVVFGAGRLPEVGGALGKTVRDFRSNLQGPDQEIEAKSTTSVPRRTQSPEPARKAEGPTRPGEV
jgi:sec-independent protein translocase protein TatA